VELLNEDLIENKNQFKKNQLSLSQENALKKLDSKNNIFLTGAAGTGKSFLLQHYLSHLQKSKEFPILASTGAAAILVGGRTFHSFFSLGIMQGGFDATVERAIKNKKLLKRIKKTDGFVLDEVSMISGPTLKAAEKIARRARECDEPWGGMRVICVGDFAQLPPVNPYSQTKEWAFLDPVWNESSFVPIVLMEPMRTKDKDFIEVLSYIRDGIVNEKVIDLLQQRTKKCDEKFNGTRLLARRDDVEKYNLTKLEKIKGKQFIFETEYSGKKEEIEKFKKNSPILDVLQLKIGALVMIRQNDQVCGRYVNGSLAEVIDIPSDEKIVLKLMENSKKVEIEKEDFSLLDADGKEVVTATNFPLSLAWSITIHKAQGASIDKLWMDLRRLWEPGQAYVALSRAKKASQLWLEGWEPRSIITDSNVRSFHKNIH